MTPGAIVSQAVNTEDDPRVPADAAAIAVFADQLAALEHQVDELIEIRAALRWGTAHQQDPVLGELLLRVRSLKGKGEWLAWLEGHGIEPRSAQRFMRAATDPGYRNGRALPESTRWLVWERDDFRCHYCGVRQYLDVDRRVAVEEGGDDELENLLTCCQTCARRKGTRTHAEFIQSIGGAAACRR